MNTTNEAVTAQNYGPQNRRTIKIVLIIVTIGFDTSGLIVAFNLREQLEPWMFWSVIGAVLLVSGATTLFCIFAGREKKTDVLYFLKPIKEWTNNSFMTFELKKHTSTVSVHTAIASSCKKYYFESEESVKKFCRNHPGLVRSNSTHFFVKENDAAPVSVVLVQLAKNSSHIVTHYLSLSDKQLNASQRRRFVIKNETIER